MEFVFLFSGLIGLTLSLALFCKVWGMCNDVEDIAMLLRKHLAQQQNANGNPQPEAMPQSQQKKEEEGNSVSLIIALVGAIILLVILCVALF